MWTNENRARYDRSRLRYPSDLTDAEWAHVVPLIPPAKRGGNRRHVDEREVVNGLMYVLSTGCPTAAIIPGSKSPGTSQSVKSAEKGGPASIRRATTPARRSWAKSATSSSIRQAC